MFGHETIPLPQRYERHGVIRRKVSINSEHHQLVDSEEHQVDDHNTSEDASSRFAHAFTKLRADHEKHHIVVDNRPSITLSGYSG